LADKLVCIIGRFCPNLDRCYSTLEKVRELLTYRNYGVPDAAILDGIENLLNGEKEDEKDN
jgi:cobyrinic acid a,c-diamide synthase